MEPVVVSLTAFSMHRARDVPGAIRAGLRLRQGWYGLPGAVGLYLWGDLRRKRTGSVSVWTNSDDLRRWVALPLHVQIMRHYRSRGSLSATTWQAGSADAAAILVQARRRLAETDFS